jgi:hypothetical protein
LKPADLAGLDHEAFVTQYWSKANTADRNQMMASWKSAQQSVSDPKAVSDSVINSTAKDSFVKAFGLNAGDTVSKWAEDDRASYANFTRDMKVAVHDFEVNDLGGARKANTKEIQKIADDMTIKTKESSWLGLHPASYAFQGIDALPDEDQKRFYSDMPSMKAALRAEGQPPTTVNLLKLYQSVHGAKDGQ